MEEFRSYEGFDLATAGLTHDSVEAMLDEVGGGRYERGSPHRRPAREIAGEELYVYNQNSSLQPWEGRELSHDSVFFCFCFSCCCIPVNVYIGR